MGIKMCQIVKYLSESFQCLESLLLVSEMVYWCGGWRCFSVGGLSILVWLHIRITPFLSLTFPSSHTPPHPEIFANVQSESWS